MPDFKEMYVKLFRSQTKAISMLQEAQQETENMYIEAEPPEITVLWAEKDSEASETNRKKE